MVQKPADESRFGPRARQAAPRSIGEKLTPVQPVEGERTRQLTARIPESLHAEIRQHLAKHDISVQDFVRNAVTEALQDEDTP